MRTGFLFAILIGGFNLVYYLEKLLGGRFLDGPYNRLTAWLSGWLTSIILPYSIRVVGASIIVDQRTSVLIVSGCNGLEAIFLLLAGMLAYPATWSQRWRSLLRYLPALFVLNLFRVVLLVFIAHRHPAYMDVFHFQVAQGVLIVFVLFFWYDHIRRIAA